MNRVKAPTIRGVLKRAKTLSSGCDHFKALEQVAKSSQDGELRTKSIDSTWIDQACSFIRGMKLIVEYTFGL